MSEPKSIRVHFVVGFRYVATFITSHIDALMRMHTHTHTHTLRYSIVGGCLHYAKRDKKKRFVSIGFVSLYTQDIVITREDGRIITLHRRNGSPIVTRKDPEGSGRPTASRGHATLAFRAPTESTADIWCAWIESATSHGSGGEEGIGVDVSTGRRVAPGRYDPWKLSVFLPLPDDRSDHIANFGRALDKIARSHVQSIVHISSPNQSQVATSPADSQASRGTLLQQLSRISGRVSPLVSTPLHSDAAGSPTAPGSRTSEERQLGDLSPIELALRLGEPPSPSFLIVDDIDSLDDGYDDEVSYDNDKQENKSSDEDDDDSEEHYHSQHIATRNKSLFGGSEVKLGNSSMSSTERNDSEEEGMEAEADGSRLASPTDFEWNGDEDSSICL